MIKKKKGFFTFIFSLIPGAGEMYMGFFRQGISIMGLAALVILVSTMLNFGPLIAILPILWFYSFFHVHNLASLSDEEFYTLEDTYSFGIDDVPVQKVLHSTKARRIFAYALIIIGVCSLLNHFTNMLYNILPDLFYQILSPFIYNIPQVIFSIVIICFGVYLIKGKKKELDSLQGIEQKEEI